MPARFQIRAEEVSQGQSLLEMKLSGTSLDKKVGLALAVLHTASQCREGEGEGGGWEGEGERGIVQEQMD